MYTLDTWSGTPESSISYTYPLVRDTYLMRCLYRVSVVCFDLGLVGSAATVTLYGSVYAVNPATGCGVSCLNLESAVGVDTGGSPAVEDGTTPAGTAPSPRSDGSVTSLTGKNDEKSVIDGTPPCVLVELRE